MKYKNLINFFDYEYLREDILICLQIYAQCLSIECHGSGSEIDSSN